MCVINKLLLLINKIKIIIIYNTLIYLVKQNSSNENIKLCTKTYKRKNAVVRR